ncbi:MAG: hypothetical protein NTY14_07420 [Candidatus Omnitrophica bacterium]|nr:hypothetical protein [Candidatus Omnitrophota bacterium]
MGFFIALKNDAIEWCQGKNWLFRLPLLLFFVYVLIRHLSDPLYSSVIGALNLGIHELGHIIFGFLGEFITVAGGTIFQLFVPVFALFNFYRQRDFFAMALSFGWLSTNLFNVATYAADARAMSLPLVSLFGGGEDGVYHDWDYMLSQLNILQYDSVVALVFRVLAVVSMLVCFCAGVWLLWQMILSKRRGPGI